MLGGAGGCCGCGGLTAHKLLDCAVLAEFLEPLCDDVTELSRLCLGDGCLWNEDGFLPLLGLSRFANSALEGLSR